MASYVFSPYFEIDEEVLILRDYLKVFCKEQSEIDLDVVYREMFEEWEETFEEIMADSYIKEDFYDGF